MSDRRDFHRGGSGGDGYYGHGGHQSRHGGRYEDRGGDSRGGFQGGRHGGRDHRGGGQRGGGRDHHGGRGRGRGRYPSIPPLNGIQMVKTNILRADIFDNFSFWQYTIDAKDRHGNCIEGSRRTHLFRTAIFEVLLKDRSNTERADICRLAFFQGQTFFSVRPIAELEGDAVLPKQILDGSFTDGDTFTVLRSRCFGTPLEFDEVFQDTKGYMITMDCKCNGCGRVFADGSSLIRHCQTTGPLHVPAYATKEDNTSIPPLSVFVEYVNVALSRALTETDLVKWGRDVIDPKSGVVKTDREGRALATVFKAYKCDFGLHRPKGASKPGLTLTVDLKSKVMRGRSILDELYSGRTPGSYNLSETQKRAEWAKWIGQIVIYKSDYKTYEILDLLFDESAESLPVKDYPEVGSSCSHAQFFRDRKKINLEFPNARPMVVVRGRRNESMFLPAELIFGEQLDASVKEQLPNMTSYRPEERNTIVDEIMAKLTIVDNPTEGADFLARLTPRGKRNVLASCGIGLKRDLDDPSKATVIKAKAVVLSVPKLTALGLEVPEDMKKDWAKCLNSANSSRKAQYAAETSSPGGCIQLQAVVFYNDRLDACAMNIYKQISDFVAGFGAKFRLSDEPELVKVSTDGGQGGGVSPHCQKVHDCLSSRTSGDCKDIFVLDFIKPFSRLDPDYHPVKQLLGKFGYLSQFVSFKSYDHAKPPRDNRERGRSNVILQGVARQILHKSGCRLWWVTLPKSLPLPAVLIGVDIYHSPRTFNPATKKREARRSCAAIVVKVVRENYLENKMIEIYSETIARSPGEEFGLRHELQRTVSNAMRKLNVDPRSCIVWRDGISESSFDTLASEEIAGIRGGLNGAPASSDDPASPMPVLSSSGEMLVKKPPRAKGVPLTYIICQKKIATKFLTFKVDGHKDFAGKYAAPPGTFVDGIQGPKYYTFYIQGRAPANSTAKPVRYIVLQKDEALELAKLDTPALTWALCHDYPNWPGPIKVPSVCMSAHKLAMQAGSMQNCGTTIDHSKFANKMHFL